MKTREEIIFEKMQPDAAGGIKPLTSDEIMECMQEWAELTLTDYILEHTRCGSTYEAGRAAKIFLESI